MAGAAGQLWSVTCPGPSGQQPATSHTWGPWQRGLEHGAELARAPGLRVDSPPWPHLPAGLGQGTTIGSTVLWKRNTTNASQLLTGLLEVVLRRASPPLRSGPQAPSRPPAQRHTSFTDRTPGHL